MRRGKPVAREVALLMTVAVLGVTAPSASAGSMLSQAVRAQGAYSPAQGVGGQDNQDQARANPSVHVAQAVPQNPPLQLVLGQPAAIPQVSGFVDRPVPLISARGPLALPSTALRTLGATARVGQAQPNSGATTFEAPTPGCSGVTGAIAMPAIQNALVAAHDGDTIDICASGSPYGVVSSSGYYLVSQNNLTIQGVGGTVVIDAGRGAQQAYGFIVSGTGNTLSSLTIQNAIQVGGTGGDGVALRGGPTTLSKLTLTNNDIGV